MKWILYIPCPKQLGTHAVQGFGVDAVVPDEAAQDFAQGPAPVHVTIRADAADGMLTIQVTDDGQGYPPAVLAVLQTGETGENPPHILGLHVVEQILAAHGGTAAFAQALPHGAAAVLTLPL